MAHRHPDTTADPARAGAAAASSMADATAATTTSSSGKEEQARKAQALAEKCFLAGNIYGARQWMQSAVRLAPALPRTAQIVAAYDVHAAAAGRRAPDCWYAVLGLQQQQHPGGVTHDDVKRQHRRLCLLVHPDKNPCAAADGAFKLVQAAWHALAARHPPGSPAAAAASQPPTPPPPWPPQRQQAAPARAPEPQPRPRPKVVQMQRRAPGPAAGSAGARPTMPSYAQRASRRRPPEKGSTQPPPPPPMGRRPISPIGDKCPSCGARTNGSRSFRCVSCQWSPMDDRPDDDDLFEDFY